MTYHSLSANNVGDTQSGLKLTTILYSSSVKTPMVDDFNNNKHSNERRVSTDSEFTIYALHTHLKHKRKG